MFKAIVKAIGGMFGKSRPNVEAAAQWQQRYASLRATYDAARTTDEFKNYWANADRYDADSANSKEVRHTLISRSRYEIGNNGYSDGIAQTYATDLVGVGPTLRMQTGSEGFNRMVELSWHLWSKATLFRRKLWCLAHAKLSDGEGFGVIRRNPRVKHPIPLDVCLYEAEQFQTPYVPFTEPGYIDGIKFDEFGNPLWFDLLRQHPGTSRGLILDPVPERVSADFVLHWFKLRRPGQHRGVPETASTLNVGAGSRRWREAVLSAAERAALLTLMMETPMTPDEADAVAPFTTMDVEKGLMNFLPMGWKPNQLDGKFPTASHESFTKSLINEQARPKSMPYNKAACDSSSYNYASGRLDHQTYYAALDIEREDANDLVLDPLFNVWFDLAVSRFGWLGGIPEAIGPAAKLHIWDWPKHRVADVEAEANANQTKLKSGQIFPHRLAADAGLDWEDECEAGAKSLGMTVDELKKRIADSLLPPVQQGGAPGQQPAAKQSVEAGWVTLDNGVAVFIDEETGLIEKGPGSMRGKTMRQVKEERDSGAWPSTQKSANRQNLNIEQARRELGKQGWEMGKAVPFQPGDKEVSYEVRHKKTGKILKRSAREIKDLISEFEGQWQLPNPERLNGHANGAHVNGN